MALIDPRLRGNAQLNKRDCTRALQLCGSREAQAVLKIMANERISFGAYDLALAAHAFARDGKHALAEQAIRQVLALPAAPEPETCTILLRSCCHSKDTDTALDVWKALRAADRWPTVPGLQHLLMACAASGAWEAALSALRECESTHAAPGALDTDVRQTNALLKACVRGEAVREAEAILAELPSVADDPRRAACTTSYNTVLHAYSAEWAGGEGLAARVARADALLERMEEGGIARDEATYATLLMLHKLDPQRALALLADAKSRGVVCGTATYAQVVRTLWWAGLSDHAWQLIDSMEPGGVVPDGRFFESAARAAASVGLVDDADKLHREMHRRGLSSISSNGKKKKTWAPSSRGTPSSAEKHDAESFFLLLERQRSRRPDAPEPLD